jgi:hypothetical protein
VRLFTDQQVKSFGSLAQLVEQLAFNQLVARSSRARPTIFSFGIPKAYRNVSLFLGLQFLSFRSYTDLRQNLFARWPTLFIEKLFRD